MIGIAIDFMDRIRPSGRVIRWMTWLLYGMGMIALTAVVARPFFTVGINLDHSLPGHVFLIHRGEMPEKEQFVAFRFQGFEPYFPVGVTFVKILAGTPGDRVHAGNHGCIEYRVNSQSTGTIIGCAKPEARDGRTLLLGPVGEIPRGRYAVRGTHPDSLDSRYAAVGWIRQGQIIGRAYRLF
ncbi:MAG: S26 family signal peptidase [Mariprofundaceae bacterium]|nr:S26 family signal peptidase [Mariprofundaceae bacterium]